eukprot:12487848-Alexandrium_andersonii.AAC.1
MCVPGALARSALACVVRCLAQKLGRRMNSSGSAQEPGCSPLWIWTSLGTSICGDPAAAAAACASTGRA